MTAAVLLPANDLPLHMLTCTSALQVWIGTLALLARTCTAALLVPRGVDALLVQMDVAALMVRMGAETSATELLGRTRVVAQDDNPCGLQLHAGTCIKR